MSKQTRQRQLAQLKARREAERRAAKRRRAQRLYGGLAVLILVVAVAAVVIVRGGGDRKAGADPKGDGTGDAGYKLADELPKGKDPYKKYTVAMANSGPDTTGSQFFVNTQDNPGTLLASNYTLVGTVTGGRAVIDKIAKLPV